MALYGGVQADTSHGEFSGGILHDIDRDNRFAREFLDRIYADYHAAGIAEAEEWQAAMQTPCPHTAWTDDAESCPSCGCTAAGRGQYEG